jgi:hypothetical protein
MCCKGFLKRILPFFLTFAVGLLIASFFVSITPNFKFEKRHWGKKHKAYDRQLETENRRLKEENEFLKRQALEREALPPMPPAPPTAPKVYNGIGNGSGSGSGTTRIIIDQD